MTKLASENGTNKSNTHGADKSAASQGVRPVADPSAKVVAAAVQAPLPGKGVAPTMKKLLPEQADEAAGAVKKEHGDADQAGALQSDDSATQQLAMVDAAAAASVGALSPDGGQGDTGSSSDDSSDGGISAPLIIGGVLLVGGGVALAAGGGGNGGGSKQNAAPVVTSATTATVAENAAITTAVYTTTATDADNDALTYTLTGADAASFNISAAGVVTLKASADFETKTSYAITVNVSDGKATTTQNVAVTVTNVNEAPVISSNGGGATAAVNVFENSTVVTTVTSTDPDAGATKAFSISGGADASKFDINATTGALSFKAAPDFETKSDANTDNVYEVTVQVSDGTLTDTQAISVTVVDVNEAPTITSGATGTVAENAAISTVVYDANATDADAGNTVVYTLTGADAALFNIDSDDGEVRLKAPANFEVKSSYSINVVATDNANPALSATKAVTISVTDVNEAPTAVVLSNQVAAVAENSVVTGGIKVADIAVTDDALGTETLTLTGADAASFEIRNGNELFYIGASPNFEAKSSYAVVVNADDATIGAVGSVEASQAFTLNVTDVNEAPTAVVLSNQVTTILENSVVTGGIKVANIAVTDDALGTETLTLTGADAASFEIRNGNELFYIGTSPNFEAKSSYAVVVNADDATIGAAGSVEASQAFTLNVTDVNEAPTAVVLSNQVAAVAENSVVTGGIKVADIAVTDDALGTETLTLTGADAASFEIRNGNELFYIGASPNFEAKSSYAVVVNADDATIGAVGSVEASQAFTLNVTDVNEAPTAVVLSNQVTTILENSVVTGGIKVANIAVTDDALGTETLTLTGADAASFEIRNGNELFYIGTSPNFEAKSSYAVVVNADDTTIGAAGSVEASQAFTLNVTDIVDLANLPSSGIFNAGIQAGDLADTNFRLTDNGDLASSVTIINFTANDVIELSNANPAFVGFSRENATDLRIDYADQDGTLAISTIILTNVLTDAFSNIDSEESARAAMGFGAATDFFQFA